MERPFSRGQSFTRLGAIIWPAAMMASVFFAGMFVMVAADGCSKVSDGLVLPTTGACVEFWINRYQALIAAMTALGAATYTARLVITQLSEMRAQRALQAYDAAKRELADIQEEGRLLFQLRLSSGNARYIIVANNNNKLPAQFQIKKHCEFLEEAIEKRRQLLFEIETFRTKCLHRHEDEVYMSNASSAALDVNIVAYDVLSLCLPLDGNSPAPVPKEVRGKLLEHLSKLESALTAERAACDEWAGFNRLRKHAARELALRFRQSAFGDMAPAS